MDRLKDVPSQGITRPGGFSFNAQEVRELAQQRLPINRKDPMVLATQAVTLYRSTEKRLKTFTRTIRESRLFPVDLDIIVLGSEVTAMVAGLGTILYGASTHNSEFITYGMVGLVGGLSLLGAQVTNYEC
jgi:hypothetical protein